MGIKKYTTTEWVDFLNHFLPNGEAFVAKYVEGTNLRSYQKAKSQEFKPAMKERWQWWSVPCPGLTCWSAPDCWEDQ